MSVREATPEDDFDILVLTREFMKEAPDYFKFNKDRVSEFLIAVAAAPNMVVFVSEDDDGVNGYILGVYTDHPFNNAKVAAELGWYMTKAKRGGIQAIRLVRAFEGWAKDMGADYVAMCDVIGLSDLENIYTRSGYALTERTFMKEV